MYKGNADALEAAASEIIPKYLAGEFTGMGIRRRFHVGHGVWQRFLRRHTSAEQREAAKKRIHAKHVTGGRFAKGHATWNKGRKGFRPPPATEFKPGCMRGAAARKYRAVGTITTRYDIAPPKRLRHRKWAKGRRPRQYIKIGERRWIRLAIHVWLQAGGRIPPDHCLVHVNGDAMDCDLTNLAVMTRAEKVALQKRNDPGAETRRRTAAAWAATARHQHNRDVKEVRGRVVRWYECHACGWSPGPAARADRPPARCPKCASSSFERLERREKLPRRPSTAEVA